MKAPVCKVCGDWQKDGTRGSWFQFEVAEPKEVELNRQIDEVISRGEVFYGDRYGNWFFCQEHSGFGLKFNHLTWEEAEPLIQKAIKNGEIPKPFNPDSAISFARVILKELTKKIKSLFKRS